jgi:stage III sporulation protein SpoIIIAA
VVTQAYEPDDDFETQGVDEAGAAPRVELTDGIEVLLEALPPEIQRSFRSLPNALSVIEVVMDLGRPPEARFGSGGEAELLEREITEEDIQYVVDHIGSFGDDNRAGIERTLHRISAIRNRNGKIVGLTCRIGRAVFGTIEIIEDLVEQGNSILIMGRPGIGKTTMLREAARVLADDLDKRVVVVDTSNEIAGDGDIPHPGIGRARRMQVRTPALQHAVMIEAVENHMPEVIVIDEIGTELEAAAARTIAERGVQLIGTAHGNSLDNLMLNPTLSDLIGGIQSVTLGDEEARRRRTQKSVLERKAPPTFDVVVEIQDRDRVTVHPDVAETVDGMLRGDPIAPEIRWRDEAGVHKTQSRPRPGPSSQLPGERFGGQVATGPTGWRVEPGWRPGQRRDEPFGYRDTAVRGSDRERGGARPGYRPGASGGWRSSSSRGRGGPRASGTETPPAGLASFDSAATAGFSDVPAQHARPAPGAPAAPFQSGEIADRGPVERGTLPPPEPRARDSREFDRQREWRESAMRAIRELRAESSAVEAETGELDPLEAELGLGEAAVVIPAPGVWPPSDAWMEPDDESGDDVIRLSDGRGEAKVPLETLHVLGFGVSRKRLEQAIRELQLPVVIVREADDADVVITLRNFYKQKAPALREAEDRGTPIYVLKSNTIVQMEACLTALFSLDVDPNEAALREVEDAIGLVRQEQKPVELSPQNAYIRRLQHQAAERANYVSRSRGREPFRRVRVYPDRVRAWR